MDVYYVYSISNSIVLYKFHRSGDFNGMAKPTWPSWATDHSIYCLVTVTDFQYFCSVWLFIGFVAWDFNGDGIQDLAVLCQTGSKNIVYILLGNGDGHLPL